MTIQNILKEFPNTKESDWHKHSNGGGWVQNTATVAETAYVGPNALVYGNAEVCGRARVCEGAQVYGRAYVCGNAEVYGNAVVCGSAEVYDNAQVGVYARVYGNAGVSGNAVVYGNAVVCGNAKVSGNHRLIGGKFEKNPIYIQGSKYAIFQSSDKTIGIGCKDFDIKTTKKELMEVAKEEGFTEEKIKEYEWMWEFVRFLMGERNALRISRR